MILQDLRYLEQQKHLDEFYDAETGEIQTRLPVKPREKYDRPHRQAGKFGAASECKVRQISKELRREALESLGEARSKQSKRIKLPLSLKQQALRDAHVTWLTDKCSNWDLAVSLHFPAATAHARGCLPTATIEEHMRMFFKILEKKVISRTGRVRLKEKLSRLMVVEKAASVGFHIHMAMLLPKGTNMGRFIRILKEQWKRFWTRQPLTFSNERAVWAEAISGDYVKYSLKNVGTERAEVLWCSSHL